MKACVLKNLAIPALLAVSFAACEQQADPITVPRSVENVPLAAAIVSGDLLLSTQAEVVEAGEITDVQGSLLIRGTDISHLTPLSGVTSVGGDLVVDANPGLDDCVGLYPLLVSGTVGGATRIGPDNEPGCNSVGEIFMSATLELRIGLLIDAVAAVREAGDLNRVQANSLTRKLAGALASLGAGRRSLAIILLRVFSRQVTNLVASGVISALDGNRLIAQAQAAISLATTNTPPTAEIDWRCPLLLGPLLTCRFMGRGSTDPDGRIVSYDWDFGGPTTHRWPMPDRIRP